nr:uncharacterized protein LOC110379462 isoform X1 [Helicoverpa armigera]XP_049702887.1 uncharacterized protein LOC110379462 isoform X2 [Helicoverpa armigera]XP_049702928.1 uncharacterized protein LOC110379462 isoform X3 [Helicoverpa armigera]XP_049702972.1 uncharacterized protein LOC110379462 isoform X4 [Helicoverpa armigera]
MKVYLPLLTCPSLSLGDIGYSPAATKRWLRNLNEVYVKLNLAFRSRAKLTGQTPMWVFLPAAVRGILTGDSPMTMFLMQPVKPRRERTPRTRCNGFSCPPMYRDDRVSVEAYAPRPGLEKCPSTPTDTTYRDFTTANR